MEWGERGWEGVRGGGRDGSWWEGMGDGERW